MSVGQMVIGFPKVIETALALTKHVCLATLNPCVLSSRHRFGPFRQSGNLILNFTFPFDRSPAAFETVTTATYVYPLSNHRSHSLLNCYYSLTVKPLLLGNSLT